MSSKMRVCVCCGGGRGGGGGFDEKLWMQNAAIIAHLMAVLKRSLIRRNLSGSFCFTLNRRTTVVLLPELITFRAGKQQLNSN